MGCIVSIFFYQVEFLPYGMTISRCWKLSKLNFYQMEWQSQNFENCPSWIFTKWNDNHQMLKMVQVEFLPNGMTISKCWKWSKLNFYQMEWQSQNFENCPSWIFTKWDDNPKMLTTVQVALLSRSFAPYRLVDYG